MVMNGIGHDHMWKYFSCIVILEWECIFNILEASGSYRDMNLPMTVFNKSNIFLAIEFTNFLVLVIFASKYFDELILVTVFPQFIQ